MADDSLKLFGFEIKRASKEEPIRNASVVPPNDDDGAGYITAPSHHHATYLDLDNSVNAKDNAALIIKYRTAATHPEVDMAIEEIVNEAIVKGDNVRQIVTLNTDEVDVSESIKKRMHEEFANVTSLLNFTDQAHDMFRAWYVDGRIYHHLIIDEKNPKQGIQEARYIDSTKVRKVKNVKYSEDKVKNVRTVDSVEEFYVFEEKPGNYQAGRQRNAIKLSPDSVNYVTSGLLDSNRKKIVSYLHKALKPINQLRMMEDSLIIYRLSRAPERRIFYVDVGNLPRGKSEEYMKSLMTRYRNKLVYDAETGQIRDDRKHMSMLEDFWLPRREGGRGTEISTLPGGQNLGEIDDILYFQKKVYQSLNVPVSRIEQEQSYSLGRATEINREEIKFQKFIDRLRNKFSKLFLDILKKQLMLKGVITEEDWNGFKNELYVDYYKDNHYTELKDSELMRERLNTMDQAAQYVGDYVSKEWVMKNILRFDNEEMEEQAKQIEKERDDGDIPEMSPAAQNTPAGQAAIQQGAEDQQEPSGDDE